MWQQQTSSMLAGIYQQQQHAALQTCIASKSCRVSSPTFEVHAILAGTSAPAAWQHALVNSVNNRSEVHTSAHLYRQHNLPTRMSSPTCIMHAILDGSRPAA
jgi:hypothetical protein